MLRGALEVLDFPVVFVDILMIYRKHYGVQSFGVLGHVRIHLVGDIFVVVRIEHQFGIRVADIDGAVHTVIIRILLVSVQAGDGNPEIAVSLVVLVFHHIFLVGLIAIP